MKIKKTFIAIFSAILLVGLLVFSSCNSDHTVTVHLMWNGEHIETTEVKIEHGKEIHIERCNLTKLCGTTWGSDCWVDSGFFSDEACLDRLSSNVINRDITLYVFAGDIEKYREILFQYGIERYFIYRERNATLSNDDFTRSARGFGNPEDFDYYFDEQLQEKVDLSAVDLSDGTGILRIFVADKSKN